MKFEELEKMLNEAIKNEGVDKNDTFKGKGEIKRWIQKKVKEFDEGNYIRTEWDDYSKFDLHDTWNGNDNFIEIQKGGYTPATINFKFTRGQHYERYIGTVTTYGIKSVEIIVSYGFESKSFEELTVEVVKKSVEDTKARNEYKKQKHNEIKEFMDKTGLKLDDIQKIVEKLKAVKYEDRKQYEEEFNDGKTSWVWYK